jgi:hypothetical protein
MRMYQNLSNTVEVNKAFEELQVFYQDWVDHVIPMYQKGKGITEPLRVTTWQDGKHGVESMVGYKATVQIASSVQNIISKGPMFLANDSAYDTKSVRFLFDNHQALVQYYTDIRQAEINDHLNLLNTYEIFVVICCVIMDLLILIIAVLVPYFSFKAFLER